MHRRSLPLIAWFASFALACIVGPSLLPPAQAQAQAPTPAQTEADRIADALTPRRTRGVGAKVDTQSVETIDRLFKARQTRGLSHKEQDELHGATQAMPQMDLDIFFDFNSADISPKAVPKLTSLGDALGRDEFKASKIIVGGHTDRKGTSSYNQSLSERRAQSVARYLAETHNIDTTRMLTTGFGFRKLKEPSRPFADANRRVQIVNAAR